MDGQGGKAEEIVAVEAPESQWLTSEGRDLKVTERNRKELDCVKICGKNEELWTENTCNLCQTARWIGCTCFILFLVAKSDISACFSARRNPAACTLCFLVRCC